MPAIEATTNGTHIQKRTIYFCFVIRNTGNRYIEVPVPHLFLIDKLISECTCLKSVARVTTIDKEFLMWHYNFVFLISLKVKVQVNVL